ncbi:MAG: hypothetical protein WBG46_10760 [Nonlabens sp.]
MKLLVFFLTILSFNPMDNFEIQDGRLYWQKVYNSDLSIDEVEQLMIESGHYKNVIIINNSITAELVDFSINHKGYGSSDFSTPSYILGSSFQAFALFEFKNGRYRATIKNIRLIQNYNTSSSDMGEVSQLEDHALKKKNTTYRNGFEIKTQKCLIIPLPISLNLKGNQETGSPFLNLKS